MKYLVIPLAVIVSLFLFGLFFSGETLSKDMNNDYISESVNGTFTQNGEEISLSTEENEYNVAMNETQGILAIILTVSVIASLIGINVLGSGLSETTVKILYNTIFFYGIWGIFSVYALESLNILPIGSGWIIYAVLTGFYSLGINKRLN